jgi:replicative DNA helicase
MSNALSDLASEEMVVAAALHAPEHAERIDSTAFTDPEMREAASAISGLHAAGEKITSYSVAKTMRKPESKDVLDGLKTRYGDLNAVAAFRTLTELRTRRDMASACKQGYSDAGDLNKEITTVISRIEGEVLNISTHGTKNGFKDGADFTAVREDFQWRLANPGKIRGITTGFPELDEMLDGIKRKKSYLIGARPGIGKSALAKDISLHTLLKGERVLSFNLEMSAEECQSRVVSTVAGVPLGSAHTYSTSEVQRIEATYKKLSALDWVIDDTPALSVDAFRSKCRAVCRERKPALVVVDYIQLMRGSEARSAKDKRLEVGEISACMKNTSKELDIPIISLAQLKRPGKETFNDRTKQYEAPLPMLSDLKESGDLEQDADVVILIHRGADEDSLIVAKNRGGPVGTISVEWLPHLTTFKP